MIIMINNLIRKISIELRTNHKFITYDLIFQGLYEILYLKYLCDIKILTYNEIIEMVDLSKLLIKDEKITFSLEISYQKYLHEIEYDKIENMIKEYVNTRKSVFDNFSFNNKKHLAVIDIVNESNYDLEGRTTYIVKNSYNNSFYQLFKLFDKILNLNNDYQKMEEISFNNYDELHYYCWQSRFSSISLNEEFFKEINNYVNKGLKVILYSSYNHINNYKNGRNTLSILKDVILLPNNKTLLIYDKKINDEISIINYLDEKDVEKLKRIVVANRRIKNVLIKVKSNDIMLNNYRLGFRLYQLEYEKKNKTINEIVDSNTRLIARLERINEVVETEINYLINK